MRRHTRTLVATTMAVGAMAAFVPGAAAFPGPSDAVADVVLCRSAGGPADVGLIRFSGDRQEQRLRVIVFSGGPPDTVIQVEGRDISGPGVPGRFRLDGGGGGKLDRRGQYDLGPDPAINLLIGDAVVASTDPRDEC